MKIFILIVFGVLLTAVQPLMAKTITATPDGSSIIFTIKHNDGYTLGYFNNFNATLNLSDDDANVQGAEIKVQMASVNTNNILRDESLRSKLFFDSFKFPEAVFQAKAVEGDRLNGVMTIKGVSKPLSLTIKRVDGKVVLEGVFNRNDYGINFNQMLAQKKKLIGDMVNLVIELKAS